MDKQNSQIKLIMLFILAISVVGNLFLASPAYSQGVLQDPVFQAPQPETINITDSATTAAVSLEAKLASDYAKLAEQRKADELACSPASSLAQGFTNIISGRTPEEDAVEIPADELITTVAGGFVPVQEVTGPLVTLTTSIQTNTAETRNLTTQICTHLKAMRRIQYAFEENEFVIEPNLRNAARVALENWRNLQIKASRTTGFQISPDGTVKGFIVENWAVHLAEVETETYGAFEDDLIEKTTSPYKDAFLPELAQIEQTESDPFNKLNSTITKNQIDRFNSGEMSGDEYLDTLVLLTEPTNNLFGYKNAVQQELLLKKQEAERIETNSLIANSGFRPDRICLEKTTKNVCKRWATVTPGAVLKDLTSTATEIPVTLYTDAKVGNITETNNPTDSISEQWQAPTSVTQETGTGSPEDPVIITLPPGVPLPSTNTSGGAGLPPPTNTPSSNPGGFSLPDFGSSASFFNISSLISSIGQIVAQQSNNDTSDNNSQNTVSRPGIQTGYTTASVNSILDGSSTNKSVIAWQTTGSGVSCKADNNWVTADPSNPESPKILFKQGENIPNKNTGGTEILHPIIFEASILRNGSPITQGSNSFVDNSLLGQTLVYSPESGIGKISLSDDYSLRIKTNSSDYETITTVGSVSPASPAKVISLLKTAIEKRKKDDPSSELHKYNFTFQIGELATENGIGIMVMKATPEYKIKCSNSAGSSTETITITR